MTDPSRATNNGGGRELFGTRLGFVLAAVGSAVGLGNMWRFPYQTAEGGGAAFVVIYLVMTFVIGVPAMLAEFAIGRRTRTSAVGAMRQIGGRRWVPVGYLLVLTSLFIVAFLSVITGWTIRYGLGALMTGFPDDPGTYFAAVSTGLPAVGFHFISMAATTAIVMAGVRQGIERMGLVLMPVLFILVIGLAVWAATLSGTGAGYAFYLRPSLDDLLNPSVFAGAASQAFLSISVGMGIMITYASYMSRRENLNREAVVIALSDFLVAFIGGLIVFPVIFALGLEGQVSESTVGALFISLPGAFLQMGVMGRVVGFAFFGALTVAAITSAVSLLEVITATLIDEFGWQRKRAAVVAGAGAAAVGLVPALSLDALAAIDQIAGQVMVVTGVLAMGVLVGWVMRSPDAEWLDGASPLFRRVVPLAKGIIRYVMPPLMLLILILVIRDTVAMFAG